MDVEQAAAQLGVKPDAVRKRLRRGTLAGRRVGNGWEVWLDAASHEPSREPASEPSHKPLNKPPDEPREQAAQAVALAEENAWLRHRVEALELALNREQEAVLRLSAALGLRPVLAPTTAPETAASAPHAAAAVQHRTGLGGHSGNAEEASYACRPPLPQMRRQALP